VLLPRPSCFRGFVDWGGRADKNEEPTRRLHADIAEVLNRRQQREQRGQARFLCSLCLLLLILFFCRCQIVQSRRRKPTRRLRADIAEVLNRRKRREQRGQARFLCSLCLLPLNLFFCRCPVLQSRRRKPTRRLRAEIAGFEQEETEETEETEGPSPIPLFSLFAPVDPILPLLRADEKEEAPHPGVSALEASKLIHSTRDCALRRRPAPAGRGWLRRWQRCLSTVSLV
jgi:hypothetical protein